MKKVTIAVPSNRGVQSKTVQCLMRLIAHGGYEFHCISPEHGYTIAENRNYSAVQALNNDSDYLFFIDDDMTFPPNTLEELENNEKDIVGVAYRPRCETSNKLGFVEKGKGTMIPLDETHIITLENSTDPKYKDTFECKAVGTGIMLINTKVLKELPRPWFQFEYYETGQCKVGEDWYFCLKAKEHGFKVWCDPRIQIGHIGSKIY